MDCICESFKHSIRMGHPECVDFFSNEEFPSTYGSPTSFTFDNDDLETTKFLLNNYPQYKDTKSSLGFTSVHDAIILGKFEFVKLFWDHKCNFLELADDGRNVFHLAVRRNDPEIVKFLLNNLPKNLVDMPDERKRTPRSLSFDIHGENIFEEETQKVKVKVYKPIVFEKEDWNW